MMLPTEYLTVDDVLLYPRFGRVFHRGDVKVKPFIYSAPMDTVTDYSLMNAMRDENQFAVVCRNIPHDEYMKCVSERDAGTFIAVGACEEQIREVMEADEHPINIAIDIAHGYSVVADRIRDILLEYPNKVQNLMSGSIATPEAALSHAQQGYTHLRVGIGPGSMCTTRVQTGVGIPQFSAVLGIKTAIATLYPDVQVIADGGIRTAGDAVKYLAAGADGIMLGNRLAYTKESPGWYLAGWEELDEQETLVFPLPEPKPILQKNLRGHASAKFQQDHFGSPRGLPEGEDTIIQYSYKTVADVVNEFRDGVAAACSLLGLRSNDELKYDNVIFVRVTNNAVLEGQAHGKTTNKTDLGSR